MFLAFFVPIGLTLCFCPECALSFFQHIAFCMCLSLVRANPHKHTHTPIRILADINTSVQHTQRGSLELSAITVCIVAYSLCLTGHTTCALLLSPVHCLLHPLLSQCKHTQNVHDECVGRRLGDVGWCPFIQSLRKSRRVSVCFSPLMAAMLKPFKNLIVSLQKEYRL